MPPSLTPLRSRMAGRDPREDGRTATPLELLFDLTFVIAFGKTAEELAHLLADGHVAAAVAGFCFATFAVSWAWINFTWFASAYDTDDWLFRLTTMVQMVGVLILALGLTPMFESLAQGEHIDNKVMVLGYVVMRVPMVLQWSRAALADPSRRPSVAVFIATLVASQVGWVALALADLATRTTFVLIVPLVLLELAGPVVAERVRGGTPWHPHHIAERYGLLVIIALGEGLMGTTFALSALLEESGWTAETALLGLAGTSLTFGLWWAYFVMPSGELLAARRRRSFSWGYGHIVLFGAIVAVGGGLHAAAYLLQEHSTLSLVGTVLTVAVPVSVYVLGVYVLYAALTRSLDPFHLLLIAGSAAVVAAGVVLAVAGAPLVWSLVVISFTPWVTVVGYELVGHRHNEQVLAALEEEPAVG
jgi:low temperature requirement protein LtrA